MLISKGTGWVVGINIGVYFSAMSTPSTDCVYVV